MLLTEYDPKKHIKQEREEAREEGWNDGNAIGKIEGRAEGKAESILELLSEYGDVTQPLEKTIRAEKDANQLSKWLKLAAKVNCIEDFEEQMK